MKTFAMVSVAALILNLLQIPASAKMRQQAVIADRAALPRQSDINAVNWKVRESAFEKLIGFDSYGKRPIENVGSALRNINQSDPANKDSRALMLFDLLGTENVFVATEKSLSEEYVNY